MRLVLGAPLSCWALLCVRRTFIEYEGVTEGFPCSSQVGHIPHPPLRTLRGGMPRSKFYSSCTASCSTSECISLSLPIENRLLRDYVGRSCPAMLEATD